MQGTMRGARGRGRPHVIGLPVEGLIRMTEDRDKWRKYVNGVANPQIEDC